MATPQDQQPTTGEPKSTPVVVGLKVLAGVAVGVAVVLSFIVIRGGLGADSEPEASDPSAQSDREVVPYPEGEPVRLNAPTRSPRCAAPSARILRNADLAFLGTVATTSIETIQVTPQAVYTGDTGPVVFIDGASQELGPLVGTVPFKEGTTYLIAAQNSEVFVCGLTGVEASRLTALYEKAFGEPVELEPPT